MFNSFERHKWLEPADSRDSDRVTGGKFRVKNWVVVVSYETMPGYTAHMKFGTDKEKFENIEELRKI
jgi:hypothetical protein